MPDDISILMGKNKGKIITLRLRNDQTIRGKLKDFDSLMNLSMENVEDISDEKTIRLGKILLRGDNILAVSLDG